MISKKTVIIVIISMVIGILLFGCCIVAEWYLSSDTTFIKWFISTEGLNYILKFAEDFAVSLISASVFLLGVELIIEKNKNKETENNKLDFSRDWVSKNMLKDAKECFEKINTYENRDLLLTNQFFAGCNFKDLTLDSENFSKTNFTGASFQNTSLIGTDFTNCILDNADFSGANASYAVFLQAKIDMNALQKAHSLWNATMPDGSLYSGIYNLDGDNELARRMGYDLSDHEQRKLFYAYK